MNKLKFLAIAVYSLLVLNLGIVGFLFLREPPVNREGPPIGREGPKNKIIELLHFDARQVNQYETLIDEHKASIRILRDDIRDAKSQLYQTLKKEDGAEKDSLIAKLGDLQKKMEATHYHHFQEIRNLCKPSQLAYFNTLTGELADFFNPEKQPRERPQ